MADMSPRASLVVAIIGFVGTLGAALISSSSPAPAQIAQYGFGAQEVGSCSGMVSSNAARMELTRQDSLLGIFSGASLRQ